MGEYRKSSIIKYTRKSLGLTQEDVAESICEPLTISRYENGKLNPTNENFIRIMEKMGGKVDLFLIPIHVDSIQLNKCLDNITIALEKRNLNKVETMIIEITAKYTEFLNYPNNRQYLDRIIIVTRYMQHRISGTQAINRLEDLLKTTFIQYECNLKYVKHILTETEILLLFNIATLYGLNGKLKIALNIFHKLDEYFCRKDIINNAKPHYLIYLQYSNFLGLNGFYDKSIEICKKEIEHMYKENKVNYLYNFYYNIGWNIIKKMDNSGIDDSEMRKEAMCYIWLSYKLCLLYPEDTSNANKIISFYNEIIKKEYSNHS